MSLGLMTCILLDEMRWAELGRSEAESVAGGGEELVMVSNFISNRRIRWRFVHDSPGRLEAIPLW